MCMYNICLMPMANSSGARLSLTGHPAEVLVLCRVYGGGCWQDFDWPHCLIIWLPHLRLDMIDR